MTFSLLQTMLRKAFACMLLPLVAVAAVAADEAAYASLRAAADSLHSVGRTDSAVVVARRALDMAQGSGRASWVVGTHSSLGVYLRSLGKVDEALGHYGEALKTATTKSFRDNADEDANEEVAALYVNLATLHLDMAHKDEAVRYAEAAAGWCRRCGDREFGAQIYGVVGSVLTACGQPAKSLKYQTESYRSATAAGNDDMAMRAAAYALLASDRLGRADEATAWRAKCRGLLPRVPAMMTRLLYYQTECSVSLAHDKPRAAIAWFDSILALDGIANLPFVVFDCYHNMHKAYAGLGDYRNAYTTLLKGDSVRDTLYERQKAESLRELTVKYETQEKELALAHSETARVNVRFWLAVCLVVLLAVGAGFVLYAQRQRRLRNEREMEFAHLRRDTERQLTARYVEGLESERARMARELHDGVCNDLMAIQMRLSDEQPGSSSLAMLGTCREQVRRISHELLPPEFGYATIDEVLRYYTYKLDAAVAGCTVAYTSGPDGARWDDVRDEVALEVYRIVQEAVGNAVRHSGASHVGVALERTAGGLLLTVADNGHTSTASGGGIGRRTMRQRAAAVGGRISVENGVDGTTVRFKMEKL